MAKKDIYQIKIINWEKHNPNPKKGYRRAMIHHGFLSDAKVRLLSPCTKLLYLSCLLVAGESQQSQIEVSHESLRFQSGVKSESIESQLTLLQSLQLLTFEKSEPLLERNRKDRNRMDRREAGEKSIPATASQSPPQKIISIYCDNWRKRYGTRPPVGGKVAGQFKNFVKDHGSERAEALVLAYLQMPDNWFVTKRHDVTTLLSNLNAVAQFLDTGNMVTRAHLNELKDKVDEVLGPGQPSIADILASNKKEVIL